MTMLNEVQEHFTKHLNEYVESGSPTVNFGQCSRILEVGCGAKFSFTAADELVGVDLTRSLLISLKKRNHNACLVLADARYLPFKSGYFEVVGAVFVLHHLVSSTLPATSQNINRGIVEMQRVTSQFGSIVIVEHLINNRFSSIFCYIFTLLLAKFSVNLNYLDIHDKVVTYFLDRANLVKRFTSIGLSVSVIKSNPWSFRGIKLGVDEQLQFHKWDTTKNSGSS